jgi:hypothetical protein
MNAFRRFLGILILLLGPAAILFLSKQAYNKISLPTSTTNDVLQWSIIIFIFVPISIGLIIFGYYAIKGEYDNIDS